jgi:hypothetical protein
MQGGNGEQLIWKGLLPMKYTMHLTYNEDGLVLKMNTK